MRSSCQLAVIGEGPRLNDARVVLVAVRGLRLPPTPVWLRLIALSPFRTPKWIQFVNRSEFVLQRVQRSRSNQRARRVDNEYGLRESGLVETAAEVRA